MLHIAAYLASSTSSLGASARSSLPACGAHYQRSEHSTTDSIKLPYYLSMWETLLYDSVHAVYYHTYAELHGMTCTSVYSMEQKPLHLRRC